MTDDEIIDECRKRYAYLNWGMYVGNSGDETKPEAKPIEEPKIESEEERKERLWKLVQEFSSN